MTEKTQFEIEFLLPDIHDETDHCVQRLSDLIEARKGVDQVHMETKNGHPPKRLCVHFDPKVISVGELRQFAQQAGVELGQQYGHLLFQTRVVQADRPETLSAKLKRILGVLDAGVSPDGVVRIEFDRKITDRESVHRAIRSIGIRVQQTLDGEPFDDGQQDRGALLPHDHQHDHAHHEHHHHAHGGLFGERTELIFAIVCGVLLVTGWLISIANPSLGWISLAFYFGAYLFGGYYAALESIQKLFSRRFEIDFLMIVAAVGSAALGGWAEGALLLFLFSLGHALEHFAMGRARKAIEALSELAPRTANVRRDGSLVEISVNELVPGDTVIVKPNERIAADGFVVVGSSSVDQAPITGESIPVDKRPVADRNLAIEKPNQVPPEHQVFAGTINQSGGLEIVVTNRARDSTLARVVKMVNEAETQKSPTQRFTDQFERYFVPAVLVFVTLLLLAFLVVDEPFSVSFYRAMAVLIAASPCALAISTPSAVLSGIARAARGGVLIKGGGPLENLGRVTAIAFDKTGTLTEGKPKVTDVVSLDGATDQELLRNVIAVESLSDHPLAAAVVRDGKLLLEAASIPQAQDIQSITGRGIKAMVEGESVFVGKDDLFFEIGGQPPGAELLSTVKQLEHQGRTTMLVRRGERFLGVIGLMDTPRETAPIMFAQLRELGIDRMIMISGDNQIVATAIANELGLDEAWGDLMPDEKVAAIKRLRSEGIVAMVGDGVNDAPAMANATVGIAMGAAGSAVALETADVALMANDLNRLAFAIGLGRQTSRIIRQNLWISLGMVAILVPATLFGLQIGLAVVFHEGSTIAVVFNALRLLAYEPFQKNRD
jgi:Cd2+/Zn2+-exporting ATPase